MTRNTAMAVYKLKLREQMNPGDVISFEGRALISRLIRMKSARSHVASLVNGPGDYRIRRLVIEADQGEVNTRWLSDKIKEYNGKIWWHPLRPELEEYRPAISAFLWAHIGTPYDYKDMLWNMFRRPATDPKAFYCSELEGAAFYYPPEKSKKFKALHGLPEKVMKQYRDSNKQVRLLLKGKALRPDEVVKLPFFLPEVRVL